MTEQKETFKQERDPSFITDQQLWEESYLVANLNLREQARAAWTAYRQRQVATELADYAREEAKQAENLYHLLRQKLSIQLPAIPPQNEVIIDGITLWAAYYQDRCQLVAKFEHGEDDEQHMHSSIVNDLADVGRLLESMCPHRLEIITAPRTPAPPTPERQSPALEFVNSLVKLLDDYDLVIDRRKNIP